MSESNNVKHPDKIAKKKPSANPPTRGYSPGQKDNTPSPPPPPPSLSSFSTIITPPKVKTPSKEVTTTIKPSKD